MDTTSNPKRTAQAKFASGLSAWFGGVAFSIGFGISAPVWMAGGLTVLSLAFAWLAARASGSRNDPVGSA
jgi:predicted MFS family arabinose efflux permease